MPLLEIRSLTVHHKTKASAFRVSSEAYAALDRASLSIEKGETVGLVGESGSGKTTLAKAIVRLIPVTSGTIYFEGRDITRSAGEELVHLRRSIQLIFQNASGSLNPRVPIYQTLADVLELHHPSPHDVSQNQVQSLSEMVELPQECLHRFPHELSGGQRQRVAIARALAVEPALLILDEPLSALDTSTQAELLRLLHRIQQEWGLTYLLVSHDLAVVSVLSHRIAVLHRGKVVEMGETDSILKHPHHPQTEKLINAVFEPP